MESDAVELNERQLKQAVNQSFMEAASRVIVEELLFRGLKGSQAAANSFQLGMCS